MAQTFDATLLESPVFRSYVFFSGILIIKMLAMSLLTGMTRFKHKAFANPEDAGPKLKPRVDENVERVRRAHLNDLENIPLFFVAGFFYTLTNPSLALARVLFGGYTAARIIHTLVYAVFVVPQPARALAFGVGTVITFCMTATVLLNI